MFLVDDLLVRVPVKIGMEVLKEINRKVDEEQGFYESEEDVLEYIKELQVSLETGEITEEEYDRREKELLDVLEELREES